MLCIMRSRVVILLLCLGTALLAAGCDGKRKPGGIPVPKAAWSSSVVVTAPAPFVG